MKRKLRYISTIILIFMISNSIGTGIKADTVDKSNSRNILIIASYNFNNDWENSIILGIKDYYDDGNKIRIEYLDSSAYFSKGYYDEFLDLLNIKYDHNDIDYIMTLDDEALDFALTYIFDKDAVFYEKPIFCLGLNTIISLSDEQKKYVNGIIDTQNGESFLRLIEDTSPKAEDIYLLSDESAYCEAFEKSIILGNGKNNKKFNIRNIKSNNIGEICDAIEKIDSDSAAFILSGTFYEDDTANDVNAEETIRRIGSRSDITIYTTLEDYVKAGALGGLINDGQKLGRFGCQQLESINENNITNKSFSVLNDVFDSCIVNYKTMRRKGKNPLRFPDNTIYINKGKYDLLLPESIILMLRLIFIVIIINIITIPILYVKHRKKDYVAKMKLLESEEREKIKNNFIILMSHELRTPLNIIINAVKLIKIRIENDNYEKDYLLEKVDYLINNSNRLLKIVNNSIDVAKIESKVLDTSFTMENIVEVIDDIIDVTSDFAKSYNIEIIFDPEEEEIESAIDKEKMERIILNLISNAIKNIKDKGTILVKCSKDDENIYISIADDGKGLKDIDKEQVFEKFFQSSNNILNRDYEGIGLGLFITKGLLDVHEGKIWIESNEDNGTIVKITMPIKIMSKEFKNQYTAHKDINELASLEFSDVIHEKENS